MAGRFTAAELRDETLPSPPPETALGALLGHITGGADAEMFQPMNVNFGLMPPLPERFRKADRKKAYTDRARVKLAEWLSSIRHPGLEPGSNFLGTIEREKVDAGSSLA
jgi:methylenetetrahydrofolate--tRNA-(uracil-5-)-methyltransferase